MPVRTCSHTRAAVNRPRHTTTLIKADVVGFKSCLNHSCSPSGSRSGTRKYQMNSCTSKGTLRNSSTYAVAIPETSRLGTVRITPRIDPSSKAMIQAEMAMAMVHPRPVMYQSR